MNTVAGVAVAAIAAHQRAHRTARFASQLNAYKRQHDQHTIHTNGVRMSSETLAAADRTLRTIDRALRFQTVMDLVDNPTQGKGSSVERPNMDGRCATWKCLGHVLYGFYCEPCRQDRLTELDRPPKTEDQP